MKKLLTMLGSFICVCAMIFAAACTPEDPGTDQPGDTPETATYKTEYYLEGDDGNYALSAEHGETLEKLGAEVVYPERDMAIRLAHRLETSKSLDFIQLSERVNISKLIIPDRLVGKTVLETNLRKHFGINIIAIENNSTVMQTVDPNYQFKKGDILFVSGEKKGLNNLLVWSKRENA